MPRASSLFGAVRFRPEALFGVTVVLAVLILLPMLLSSYDSFVATSGVIFAILLLGLGVVTGRAGMIILCQMSYMAVGAWVLLWLQVHAPDVPVLVGLLISAVCASLVGALTGLPALRVRGINLAVITLAFAIMLNVVFTVNSFPGAESALYVARPEFVTEDREYFYLCAAIFLAVAGAIGLLGRSRIGTGWSAVRHSERATAAQGRSAPWSKTTALTISGFCAGIAGGLLIIQLGTTTVQSFSPLASLTVFALAIMMGTRYIEGALLGGLVYAFAPEIFGSIGISQNYGNVLFAVGAVLGLKGGLGAAEAIRAGIRKRFAVREEMAEEADGSVRDVSAGSPDLQVVEGSEPPGGKPRATTLAIEGLSYSYGTVPVLNDVTFDVSEFGVTALIGPNGAGKSTLIDCVSGFINDYRGSIVLDGEPVEPWSAKQRARRGLRRSFQQDRTIPDVTVDQYVRMGLTFKQSRELANEELESILRHFSCPAPSRLISGVDVSSRRLLEVAGAVAARPAVVLLDEPAAGLAASDSERLAREISAIPEKFGTSVVVVEHDMDLVAQVATQVVVLDFGEVIASGDPVNVMADPRVVKAYLGEEFVA